jgi:hypothetical protein
LFKLLFAPNCGANFFFADIAARFACIWRRYSSIWVVVFVVKPAEGCSFQFDQPFSKIKI